MGCYHKDDSPEETSFLMVHKVVFIFPFLCFVLSVFLVETFFQWSQELVVSLIRVDDSGSYNSHQ